MNRTILTSPFARIALRTGHKLQWDPAKERLVSDDPKAQALMDAVAEEASGGGGGVAGLLAALLVEGMTCPACAWVIERALVSLPGVEELRIQIAHHLLDHILVFGLLLHR